LVLLHGWGVNLGTFDDLSYRLSQNYRVIRLDFPGFGGSERPKGPWGVEEYTILTRNFLEKLGIKQVHAIIGHSFGGRVGIKGLGRKLLAADKLVLVDSAGINSTNTARNQFYRYAAKGGKLIFNLPILSLFRSTAQERLYRAARSTDYLKVGQMKEIFLKTIREDLRPDAKHVAVPVLMIWGEKDDVTPVKEAELMRAEMADAELVVLPGARHFAYLDEPEKVTELIQEFVQ
jgi:pimeloyl-ACP methyl ester carboxylesterase